MTQAEPSDETLMGQVRRGRREELEPLVRRYARPLLTYLERMVGDRHRAEELFQDAFLAVWEKRRTYRFPQPFRPWLFAIATNRCRAAFRRARGPEAASLPQAMCDGPAATDVSPPDAAVAAETARLVTAAVARLPDQQRTVIVLRTWNGLSFAEIAQSLGVGEATVRSHMHHALTALRRFLEPRMKPE
jgi:RNA polymerase sigma-70 factor (ECF subfamily)